LLGKSSKSIKYEIHTDGLYECGWGGGLKALQEYFYLLEQESDISYAALFEKFSNKVSLKDTKE